MINRRQFIKTTGAVAVGAVLPGVKALAQYGTPVGVAKAVADQKKRSLESRAGVFEVQCWWPVPRTRCWQVNIKEMLQEMRNASDIQY